MHSALLVEQNAFIALDIANRGYILNVGKVTIEDNASDLMENPIVQEAYMGIK